MSEDIATNNGQVSATGERNFIYLGGALIAGLALFVVFGLGGSSTDDLDDQIETASAPATDGSVAVSPIDPSIEDSVVEDVLVEPIDDVPDELAFDDTDEPSVELAELFEGSMEEDGLEGLPPLSSLPMQGAYFREDILFLEGPVASQAEADQFFDAAAAVVGPDNVVNNYIVRPDAPAVDGAVQVEQAVEFDSGSAVINEAYFPTLELAVAVMGLNPQAALVIEGHTDNVGSDEDNLVLSQARADAVVEYLADRGVEADRLQAVGVGEAEPVADNDTADGRFLNRRIEFDIVDLLMPVE